MGTLKKQILRGSFWTLTGYGARQVVRFGSNLILTRLLTPDIFGLMALGNTFIIGLEMFSDIGVQPSVVRSPRGEDPSFYNTAWTLQVFRGFGLTLCCGAIAYPVARFYDTPELLWVVPLLGLTASIRGFKSTALFVRNRRMDVGPIVRLNLVVQIVIVSTMAIWAWWNPTIWALIVGNWLGAGLHVAASHRLNDLAPNRFAWEAEARKELLNFGRWIFISTALTFLASQADRLLLGRLLTLEQLGVYGIAFFLATSPVQIVNRMSNSIVFPAISQLANSISRQELRAKLLNKREPLLLACAFGLSLLIGFGDLAVGFLYDDRYRDAEWMLPLLSFGIWPVMLEQSVSGALLAYGKSNYIALATGLKFAYMLVALPLGFAVGGMPGAIVAIVFNDIPMYLAVTFGLARLNLSAYRQDLRLTLAFAGFLAIAFALRSVSGLPLPVPPAWQ